MFEHEKAERERRRRPFRRRPVWRIGTRSYAAAEESVKGTALKT
jgi:hypothetical protein